MSVTNDLLPVFLKLSGRTVVLVGGGPVAASKLDTLVRAGSNVRVVAPSIRPEMRREEVAIIERPFRPEDLDGAYFVVAAATPEVNREVLAAAEERRLFVNAVDDPEAATAFLGGVVQRSGVTVAISTGGRAPALAGLLREVLDAVLPSAADLQAWVDTAESLRGTWRAARMPMGERRPALLKALVQLYSERRAEV